MNNTSCGIHVQYCVPWILKKGAAMINKDLNIPLYIQIYNDLKNKIIENRYNEEFLPSERILSEEYNVERATLRRSLQLLVKDKLLIKVPGSGSKVNRDFLTKPSINMDTSNNIAFILPGDSADKIDQPFIASLFYNFERGCHRHNYSLFYTKLDSEEDLYERVVKKQIKGIVWVSKVNENLIYKSKELEIPSVCVSNYIPGFKSILCDNYEGSFLAIDHLVRLGHKKIAYINGIKTYLNALERYTGYIRAMGHLGLQFDEGLVREGDWTFESGYETTKDILTSIPGLTAIFAANDMMALGAVKAIHDSGMSVPGDISVVGFDNIDQSMYSFPSLTTIDVNTKVFARETLKALHLTIEDSNSPAVKVLIPNSLVVRESTRRI